MYAVAMTESRQWYDLVRPRLKQLGYVYEDVAERFGVSPGNVGHWLKGRRRPPLDTYWKLIELAGVTQQEVDAFIAGDEPRPPAASIRHAHANVEPGPNIITTVPLISWVQAGEWSEVVDLFEPGEADEWVPTTRHVGPHAFAVRVKGDSMTAPHGPSFPEGTKLIVDPTASADHGSFVIAKLASDQEATFKRLAFDGPRRYLQPLNQAYQTIDITERDCVICGVVVQAMMDV